VMMSMIIIIIIRRQQTSGMLTHIHKNRRCWLFFFPTSNARVLWTVGSAADSIHLCVDRPPSSAPLSTRIWFHLTSACFRMFGLFLLQCLSVFGMIT
jgi:hypothetical protein